MTKADCRDLNYSCYFSEGAEEFSQAEEYNSHNTERLDVEGMCEMLMKLEIVRKAMNHKVIVITGFNIESRYPDFKGSFRKKCTEEFTVEQMNEIRRLFKWLGSHLK